MVVFGATRLIGVSATASDIIEKRDLAAVELTRAAHAMSGLPHAVFAMLLYDQDDPARKASKRDFETLVPEAGKLLSSAATHLPDKATEIGKFKERFDKIAEAAKEPLQISLETPGLIYGIGIQQIDLVQMGHGASSRDRGRHPGAHADRRHERLQRGAARRQRQRQPGVERQGQPGRHRAWRWSASSRPCSPAPSRCG